MSGGGNAGTQMQDHVKRQQMFEVCFNEQTRKATAVEQNCIVTRARWVSYGLFGTAACQQKVNHFLTKTSNVANKFPPEFAFDGRSTVT